MKNVILGSFYDSKNEAKPETILISFFDKTLRIRLELGARTMFTLPFMPVINLIKEARSDESKSDKAIKIVVQGHYANLQNNVKLTQGDITVSYTYYADECAELIGFSAPDCGKIRVNLKRMIPFMDSKMRCSIGQDDETEI